MTVLEGSRSLFSSGDWGDGKRGAASSLRLRWCRPSQLSSEGRCGLDAACGTWGRLPAGFRDYLQNPESLAFCKTSRLVPSPHLSAPG